MKARSAHPVWQRWLPTGLLLILVGLGLGQYQRYGLSWDEIINHHNGAVNSTLLLEALCPPAWQARLLPHDPQLHPRATWPGYDHGPAFELPAAALGRVLYPSNPRGYLMLRHLLVFLVFTGGLVAFYQLARYRYPASRWLPLLGAALLVLSPRLLAESFYNGKDMPFLVLFTLAMLTLVRLLQRPSWGRVVAHAAATALAADVRLVGLVLLPAFTLGALLVQPWAARTPELLGQPATAGRRLDVALGYGVLTLAFTILCWPYLWANPGPRLWDALEHSSHYPWLSTVQYLGQLVPTTQLPWHYLPVWIAVTTPVAYQVLALLGVARAAGALARRGWAAVWQGGTWLDVLFLGWLAGPIVLVVLNHSVVYDGWRHVYFVYPALLLLALGGVRVLGTAWQRAHRGGRTLAGALGLLLALEASRTAWFIVQAAPNQQVYFSFLPAATAERLFERDYWGLSYRYGLEWLLRHDAAPRIRVSGPQEFLLYINWLLLTPAQQQRIAITTDSRTARYYLTGYRWHAQPYPDSLGPEVLAYRPGGGIKALSIFRRDSLRRPLPPAPLRANPPAASE